MALQTSDKRMIARLRRQDVEETLAGLRPVLASSRWAATANRYAVDTIARLQNDINSGNLPNQKDLSQYIAASALLHSSDGWSYLGRAVMALLQGDPHRARHLGYYAELRASSSLLATEGVGVFNKYHFAVTGRDSIRQFRSCRGTHQFSWECLEHWSGLQASGQLFAKMIRPYGISLAGWFAGLGGVTAVAPQVSSWFRQWGVDLQNFPDDRDARNTSSYQPDGIPTAWYIDSQQTLEFVRDLWASFEPSPSSRFETVDRHILRIGLEKTFLGRTGAIASSRVAEFRSFIEPIVNSQSFTNEAERECLRFLLRQTAPHDARIFHFSQIPAIDPLGGAQAVLSRAALLLRVASGSTAMLLQESGCNPDAISFWANNLGEGRGFWEGAPFEEPSDLWADIASILEDVEKFQQSHDHRDQSFFKIGRELGHAIAGLSGCERVAIWGMMP